MGVALVGFLVCVGIIIAYYKSLQSSQNKFEELAQMKQESIQQTQQDTAAQDTAAEEATQGNDEAETTKPEESATKEETYVSPIDFQKLQETENSDIYAWIQVDGTTVDYPVLQHPFDDTFYMLHNLDGSYGFPGCIYTENYNDKGFTDNVTLVYGHYMKDGSMFASLHRFMDQDFFDQHDTIVIYLPEEEKTYTILAACHMDDRRLTVWYDFNEKDNVQDFLDSILSMEQNETDHLRDMEVTSDDKFIVLETCVDEDKKARYAVVAVENR